MKWLRFLFAHTQEKQEPDTMKFLIAGLGNYDPEYTGTRHNIGFDVVDQLAAKHKVVFSSVRYAELAEFRFKGKTFILIKPTTYMNLSGKAVKYWMEKENIDAEQLLVITDDINLPLGKLRMRKNGSDGGHNGLKNIQELLGTNVYPRLRFGVGNDFHKGAQVHFVLGTWSKEELKTVEETVAKAADAVISYALEGIDRAMNRFN